MCCLSGKESDQKSAELHLTINFHFAKGKHQARQESDCLIVLLTCSFRIIYHLSFKKELDAKHPSQFKL